MECPYCKKEMIEGYIYGESYALKWLPADKELLGGTFALGGIKLKSSMFGGRQNVKAFNCLDCNKLIIDLNVK